MLIEAIYLTEISKEDREYCDSLIFFCMEICPSLASAIENANFKAQERKISITLHELPNGFPEIRVKKETIH